MEAASSGNRSNPSPERSDGAAPPSLLGDDRSTVSASIRCSGERVSNPHDRKRPFFMDGFSPRFERTTSAPSFDNDPKYRGALDGRLVHGLNDKRGPHRDVSPSSVLEPDCPSSVQVRQGNTRIDSPWRILVVEQPPEPVALIAWVRHALRSETKRFRALARSSPASRALPRKKPATKPSCRAPSAKPSASSTCDCSDKPGSKGLIPRSISSGFVAHASHPERTCASSSRVR